MYLFYIFSKAVFYTGSKFVIECWLKRSTLEVATHFCKNLSTRESYNDNYQLLVIINLHSICYSFPEWQSKIILS